MNDTSLNCTFGLLNGEHEARLCAQLMSTSEPWITLQRTYEDSLKVVQNPLAETWIVRVGSDFTGFGVIWLQGAFVGYIQSLAVEPGFRERGLGKKLLQFLEARIFERQPNVFICCSSFNTGVLELYKQFGYEIVGHLRDFVVHGHSEILMRKSIAPIQDFNRLRGAIA
jgi:ribosomal protein S18 acetylase RimI-like enzyme